MSEIAHTSSKYRKKSSSTVSKTTAADNNRLERILAEPNDPPIKLLINSEIWSRLNTIDKELAALKGKRMEEALSDRAIQSKREDTDRFEGLPQIGKPSDANARGMLASARSAEEGNK